MILRAKQFNGGVNTEDFAGSLAENEMTEAINVLITKKGSLKKREGSSEYGTDANTSAITVIKNYTNDAGTSYKFKAYGTKVVEYNTGSWDTDIKTGLTTGLYLQMSDIKCAAVATTTSGTASSGTTYSLVDTGIGWTVNAYRDYIVKITAGTGSGQIKTILENTADTLYVDGRWDITPDGTSQYTIHAKVKAIVCNNGTDTGFKIITATATDISGLPKFTDQVVHNNRLWGILGTKLYWSGLANGEQWDGYAVIDTGEDLVGIGRTKDFLIIYSNSKTGVLVGTDPDQFYFKWRENTHGCIAKHSIASYGGYSIALSQSGVYAFDGSSDYLLSRKIRPVIDAISSSLKSVSSGFVFDDRYYLMIAEDSDSTEKDVIWVLDLIWSNITNQDGVWTKFEGLSANVMGTYKDSNGINKLYIGNSTDSKVLLLYDDTYSDSDSSIKMSVKTKEWDLDAIGSFKRLGWFFYEGAIQTIASSLQIYKNLDAYGFELFATVDHLQSGGLWDNAVWDVAVFSSVDRVVKRYRPGSRGRTIQYQFFNNTSDEPVEIFKLEQELQGYNYH
jgi:hypothetical protein